MYVCVFTGALFGGGWINQIGFERGESMAGLGL